MKTLIKSFAWTIIPAFLWLVGCQNPEMEIIPENQVQPLSFFGNWEPIEGQYIVVYKADKVDRLVNARLITDFGERLVRMNDFSREVLAENHISEREVSKVYAASLQGFVVRINAEEVHILLSDDRIAYIEQDQFIPFEKPPWAGGGTDEGGSTGQEIPWGITRVNGGVNAVGKTAWIIDTGIDLDHPDLNIDLTRSRTFVSSGKDSRDPDDNDGHGTHVAGTIGAIDNDFGVIGVAAGASVVSVKVLSPRGGTLSDVIAGVDYVGAQGRSGDVANMSLGGGASKALDDAVKSAAAGGVKFIIAAGNSGADANNYSPARANGPNIFTISAMNEGDTWASFSNWGNPPVDYCAPGVSVKSTYLNGGYRVLSGTSMAAPHAAGVLLLGNNATDGVVSGDPDGSPDAIIVH
jgi:subtilisin family serine protease